MSGLRALRVVEFYCGIGGCAAALKSLASAETAQIVAAIDINRVALRVYRHNFDHPTVAAQVESVSVEQLQQWNADLWWMSPPCQPFTHRGLRRDLDDPRAQTLLAVIERIVRVQPTYVAFENVPGFQGSRGHQHLLEALQAVGYRSRQEHVLCPSDFGLPNRRRRYYLVASRGPGLRPFRAASVPRRGIGEFLDADPDPNLRIDPERVARYQGALDLVRPDDSSAVTNCFTSAYGRSWVKSGSYLVGERGVRRFSPGEILRLLGFPGDYTLPKDLPLKNGWRLVGNSLSVPVVRAVLGTVPV